MRAAVGGGIRDREHCAGPDQDQYSSSGDSTTHGDRRAAHGRRELDRGILAMDAEMGTEPEVPTGAVTLLPPQRWRVNAWQAADVVHTGVEGARLGISTEREVRAQREVGPAFR